MLEAKDTVMIWKQIVECSHNPVLELRERDICAAQAEISFKAGIKEVMETTIYLALANGNVSIKELFELHPEGKAKLKSWGIKED